MGYLSTYAGGGVSFAGAVGDSPPECTEREAGGCSGSAGTSAGFAHGRLGLGYRFPDLHLRIGLDGGFWYGRWDDGDPTGISGTEPFLIPMAGFVTLLEL